MPKKKPSWMPDFTLNDSANASKPVTRLKKAAEAVDTAWDEMDPNFYDLVEQLDQNGSVTYVYKKKKQRPVDDDIESRPGIVYPEIVFYLISAYIKPEQVGSFAGINKASYACTQRESFWRNLYKRYCQGSKRLPQRLQIEKSFQMYGLRQRVIRALHHTYSVFVHKIEWQSMQENRPDLLIRRRCINVWYNKGPIHWLVYFKFKKVPLDRPHVGNGNMLEELGRIDANPDQDCQVLQVTCASFYEVPPLLGMTLCSVMVVLSPGYRHHRISMGFSSSPYFKGPPMVPEQSVVIDTVVTMFVLDWWHPRYPHFDNTLPPRVKDEEAQPMLRKEFLNMRLDE